MPSNHVSKLKNCITSRKGKRTLFFVLMMLLPLIQFVVFYICVNFNSIIMSFQNFKDNPNGKGYLISFAGFSNFITAWNTLAENFDMILRSFWLFITNVGFGIAIALFFSYYIYKEYVGSKAFKVFLFMPQIVSAVVFTLLFKYMVTDGYIEIVKLLTGKEVEGLLSSTNSTRKFITILFYNLWMGFGTNVLLFSGAMAGINPSVVESAELDGVNSWQEFWSITIPMIFPTLTSFIILGFAGFFTNQMNLYTFFEKSAVDISVVGYFLFVTAKSSNLTIKVGSGYMNYSQLSALGLILTAIVIPVTLIAHRLLVKFGPSVD